MRYVDPFTQGEKMQTLLARVELGKKRVQESQRRLEEAKKRQADNIERMHKHREAILNRDPQVKKIELYARVKTEEAASVKALVLRVNRSEFSGMPSGTAMLVRVEETADPDIHKLVIGFHASTWRVAIVKSEVRLYRKVWWAIAPYLGAPVPPMMGDFSKISIASPAFVLPSSGCEAGIAPANNGVGIDEPHLEAQ